LIVKNSLVTAMEFSRCARVYPPNREIPVAKFRSGIVIPALGTKQHRSLKTQQRSSRSTFF